MLSVFQKFGGIRPMAAKLGGTPPSTVKSWHKSGRIPCWRHQMILATARRHGISLTPDELTNVKPDAAEYGSDSECDGLTEFQGAQTPHERKSAARRGANTSKQSAA